MATDKPNRMPVHLRNFYRPSIITSAPLRTQAPYSYTLSTDSRIADLCPPHWRIDSRKNLRAKVKSIFHLPSSASVQAEPAPRQKKNRPSMMRMKDSDDYLTARAANPWTGVVSPSVGSPSPRTPVTPETPGEVSKAHARPPLSRANEGRKVSGGSLKTWRAGSAYP